MDDVDDGESLKESVGELQTQLREMRDYLEREFSVQKDLLEQLVELPVRERKTGSMHSRLSKLSHVSQTSVRTTQSSMPSIVRSSMSAYRAKTERQSVSVKRWKSEKAQADEVQLQQERLSIRSQVRKSVFSPQFTLLVNVLILVSVVLLGVEVDVAASMDLSETPSWFSVVNAIIVIFFTVEIVLKVFGLGCREFWCGHERAWNAFDFFIVLISVLDLALEVAAYFLAASIDTAQLRLARSIRLARALRGVRVLRVFRYIAALRTLAVSIISTLGSLFWTLVLMILVFYSFAVVLCQLVAYHCRDLRAMNMQCSEHLRRYWASVPEGMLTLFMTITNGVSWDEVIRPLREVSPIAVILAVLYVTIAIFALLNVITGVFCNTAIESAHADKEVATIKQVRAKDQQVEALKAIFHEIDNADQTEVSFQEVQDAVSNGELSSFMEACGISTDDIWSLCMLLDENRNGLIDLDEFVSGCVQLHGPAKSLQLAKMSFENKLVHRTIQSLVKEVSDLKALLDLEADLQEHF